MTIFQWLLNRYKYDIFKNDEIYQKEDDELIGSLKSNVYFQYLLKNREYSSGCYMQIYPHLNKSDFLNFDNKNDYEIVVLKFNQVIDVSKELPNDFNIDVVTYSPHNFNHDNVVKLLKEHQKKILGEYFSIDCSLNIFNTQAKIKSNYI